MSDGRLLNKSGGEQETKQSVSVLLPRQETTLGRAAEVYIGLSFRLFVTKEGHISFL